MGMGTIAAKLRGWASWRQGRLAPVGWFRLPLAGSLRD